MGRFNYHKRGVRVMNLPKMSRGLMNLPDVISKGYFDESPYWEMSLMEIQRYRKEIEDHSKKHPHISKESIEEFTINRRAVYNKRIEKLRKDHQEYESKRINLLHSYLIQYFGVDVFDQAIERCDNIYQLFSTYKTIVDEIRLQAG